MKISTGINGFGRVGLHLLKYWLDRGSHANFEIDFINDDFLSINAALQIITSDKAVIFNKYKVSISGDNLILLEPNGNKYCIRYTNTTKPGIPWIGKPEIILECSGKSTISKDCEFYLVENTKLVIISATSWDCEKILVYGFNHEEYNKNLKVISYGSCTVNAYVPLANYIHKKYGVIDSDANVTHNIQEYRLKDFNTLNRKFCTLEKVGPRVLGFMDANSFIVNYTVVPYSGVSTIDFRFRLKNKVERAKFIEELHHAVSDGDLKGLYDMDETDLGPEVYNCTTYSAVFVKDSIKVLNDNVYIFSYFDNENSVNRYFDLVNYISSKLFQE